MPFTSRTKSWTTIKGTHPLSKEEADNLFSGNGLTSVFFLPITLYRDNSGEHELDSCTVVQTKDVIHNCQHHNGPAEPIKHKKLLPKQHFWDNYL